MELLKEKILKEGHVEKNCILKVDSFLNHQLDIKFFNLLGQEFRSRFKNVSIDKILTIEASGIAIASITSQYFDFIPVIFAKKSLDAAPNTSHFETKVHSYTKNLDFTVRISKKYIKKDEKILIIDDFLAQGSACLGLIDLVQQAGGIVAGIGIVIEKGFQDGGKILEKKGFNVQSLAVIDSLEDGKIIFR